MGSIIFRAVKVTDHSPFVGTDHSSDGHSHGPFGRWTLAGCNSFGIIYATSIDASSLKITLWDYNDIQRMWKVLVVSDLPSPPRIVKDHYLLSAIYNEELGRVDVFMESDSKSYVLRFITIPAPKLENVFSAANDGNIQFDGARGPSIHYIGEHLVVTGSKRDDFGEVFRIFQVATNEERNTFTLLPVWNSERSGWYNSNHVVASGKTLLMVASYAKVHCFTPNLTDGITQWPEPARTMFRSIRRIFGAPLCPSANSSGKCWIIPQEVYRSSIMEVIVAADGHLGQSRVLDWHTLGDAGVYWPSSTGKFAAASSTHVFWITRESPAIASVQFNVPTLQYLCLSKLCSTIREYRQCQSEEEALQLGIPILAWRRYCQ